MMLSGTSPILPRMQRLQDPSRPDPHQRLDRLKLVAGATTGLLTAGLWLLVAAHVADAQQLGAPPRPTLIVRSDYHEDGDGDDGYFGAGSSLANGANSDVPVLHSSGS